MSVITNIKIMSPCKGCVRKNSPTLLFLMFKPTAAPLLAEDGGVSSLNSLQRNASSFFRSLILRHLMFGRKKRVDVIMTSGFCAEITFLAPLNPIVRYGGYNVILIGGRQE